MPTICRKAFEAQPHMQLHNLRRHANDEYHLKAVRTAWRHFQTGWKAMGEQCLEVYSRWAVAELDGTLKAALEALIGADDGE